jgi:hypothetical protein
LPPSVLTDAASRERALIADLDATTGGTAAVRLTIRAARADHAAHLAALEGLLAFYRKPHRPPAPVTGVPRTHTALAAAEFAAAAAEAGWAAQTYAAQAALLASIAACEATHAALLTGQWHDSAGPVEVAPLAAVSRRSSEAGAWQAALASEHQAVYGYGLLGPQLDSEDQQQAMTYSAVHEALRDATATALAAAGFVPVPPAPDYPSLYPVSDPASARRLALRLEADCAAAWRYVYLCAATPIGSLARRASAQNALTASALRATAWRQLVTPAQASTAFPGT